MRLVVLQADQQDLRMGAEVRPTPVGGWSDDEQVSWYLGRIGRLEARQAGERALADVLRRRQRRGRCSTWAAAMGGSPRWRWPSGRACSGSSPSTARRRCWPTPRDRFADDSCVEVRHWDLGAPITPLGSFDLIVSGFAIHHLDHARKQALFGEIAAQLTPGGAFLNLEVVASATPRRHAEFLAAIGRTADDPEGRLAPVEDQLAWMRAAGLTDVDCLWRWRGFALRPGECDGGDAGQSRRAMTTSSRPGRSGASRSVVDREPGVSKRSLDLVSITEP